MARREYARIGTDMPDEPSIRDLDVEPQWLYDRLLMRPEMSRCGIIPHRPALWADLARNGTEPKVRRWMRALVDGRHVIVDERYAEVLVRTYVRHDGLLGQPNVVANMCTDFWLIASDRLRIAFLAELRRIWDLEIPDTWRGGWLLAVGVYPEAKPNDGDKEKQWPAYLPSRHLERLQKALDGTGILGPFREAITQGFVDPFTEASPEGLPPGLLDATPNPTAKGSPNPLHARANAGARTFSERRAPSAVSERRAPNSEGLAEVDHKTKPAVTREAEIGLGSDTAGFPYDEPPF